MKKFIPKTNANFLKTHELPVCKKVQLHYKIFNTKEKYIFKKVYSNSLHI